MSQALLSPVETVTELCRGLRPASQATLLRFAQFLKFQEVQAAFDEVDEEDEAEWDRHFSDPAKVANFARWADQSRARSEPQPIDPTRL